MDKSLFLNHTPTLPDTVNRVDKNNDKQGLWIYYIIDYDVELIRNPKPTLDRYDTTFFINECEYGKYEDNQKIGDWYFEKFGHSGSSGRIANYYRSDSSIAITKNYLYYYQNTDSTIVFGHYLLKNDLSNKMDTVYLNCSNDLPKSQKCMLVYQDIVLDSFPLNRAYIKLGNVWLNYDMKIYEIQKSHKYGSNIKIDNNK